MHNRGIKFGILLAGASLATASTAQTPAETVKYTYDAKGRLLKVERSGTVNNNIKAEYSHDKADNRSNLTVTGSPKAPPS